MIFTFPHDNGWSSMLYVIRGQFPLELRFSDQPTYFVMISLVSCFWAPFLQLLMIELREKENINPPGHSWISCFFHYQHSGLPHRKNLPESTIVHIYQSIFTFDINPKSCNFVSKFLLQPQLWLRSLLSPPLHQLPKTVLRICPVDNWKKWYGIIFPMTLVYVEYSMLLTWGLWNLKWRQIFVQN